MPGEEMVEEYVRQCRQLGVKRPNREVMNQLRVPEGEELEVIDLTLNYVGQRGLLAVMETVARSSTVTTVVFGSRNAELSSDNETIERLFEIAITHPTLTALSVLDNPVTAYGAQHLLRLVTQNKRILQLEVKDPEIDKGILDKINAALNINMTQEVRDDEIRCDSFKTLQLEVASASVQPQRRRTGVSAEVMGEDRDPNYRPVVVPKSKEEEDKLEAAMHTTPLFNHLIPDELHRFISIMYLTKWKPGENIIELNTTGENMYILAKGQVRIIKEGEVVATKGEMELFGELELMYDTPACATVQAVGHVEAWAITRQNYQHVMIGEMTQRRANYIEFLSGIPFTKHLTPPEKLQIADALQSKIFEDGEVVMEQGSWGETMYIVVEGAAVITRLTDEGKTVNLGIRTVGEYFGEFEFLFNVPRFCTVTAQGLLRTLFLKKRDFEVSMGPVIDLLKRNTDVYQFYVSEDGTPVERSRSQIGQSAST